MTNIEFQIDVEARRPQTLVNPVASVVLEDEYDYPFIIAAVPSTGRTGDKGDKGDKGDTGDTPVPFAETLAGPHNGVTVAYPLTHAAVPYSLQVYRNGLLEISGIGYTLSGSTVTFTTPPLASDLITVTYYIQP